jgi:hypothetical protein
MSGLARIFDEQTALKGFNPTKAVIDSAKSHNVKVIKGGKIASSMETPELQAADFTAGAIGSKYNRKKPKDFVEIGTKTKVRRI